MNTAWSFFLKFDHVFSTPHLAWSFKFYLFWRVLKKWVFYFNHQSQVWQQKMQYSLFSNPFSKYIYPIEFVRKLTCCLRETDVPGINSMRITTFLRGWVKTYFNICKLHPILDLLCRQPQLATRAVLIGTEIQKARRMFSEAALEFIRLTGEVRSLHLIISNCYQFFPHT